MAEAAILWYRSHANRFPREVVRRIREAVQPAPQELARETVDSDDASAVDAAFVEAVASYQKERGLAVDGKAGESTLTALFGADIRPAEKRAVATESGADAEEGPEGAHGTQPEGLTGGAGGPQGPGTLAAVAGVQAAVASDEWVTQAPADGDYTGLQKTETTSCKEGEVYDAISAIAPNLSHELKVMLVGHASVEQKNKCLNNNFMGMEGNGSKGWVLAWTSAAITRAKYEKNPQLYRDWFAGRPNAGVWHKKPAGTIQVQLERGEETLIVLVRKRRPGYKSLDSAAVAFVHNIEAKFHRLQGSGKKEYLELAERALGGDATAYARIVTLRDKKLGVFPYNTDGGYPARVVAGIEKARTELASRAAPK